MVIIIAMGTFLVGLVIGVILAALWLPVKAPYHMEQVKNFIFAANRSLSDEELRTRAEII
jgi:hypothetical protein